MQTPIYHFPWRQISAAGNRPWHSAPPKSLRPETSSGGARSACAPRGAVTRQRRHVKTCVKPCTARVAYSYLSTCVVCHALGTSLDEALGEAEGEAEREMLGAVLGEGARYCTHLFPFSPLRRTPVIRCLPPGWFSASTCPYVAHVLHFLRSEVYLHICLTLASVRRPSRTKRWRCVCGW